MLNFAGYCQNGMKEKLSLPRYEPSKSSDYRRLLTGCQANFPVDKCKGSQSPELLSARRG
jgi:hypothetical protein